MASRSYSVRILLVAWRVTASSSSAAGMPAPPEEIAELIYTTALRVLEPKSV